MFWNDSIAYYKRMFISSWSHVEFFTMNKTKQQSNLATVIMTLDAQICLCLKLPHSNLNIICIFSD